MEVEEYPDLPTWEDVQAMLDEDDVEEWHEYLAVNGFDNVDGPAWPFPPYIPPPFVQVGGYVFNAAERVIVEAVAARRNKKINLNFERFKVTVRDVDDVPVDQKMNVITQILDHILGVVLTPVGNNDRVRLVIESDTLRRGPIYTPITNRDQLTVDRWMLAVQQILNSCEEFRLDESFHVMVEYAKVPTGGCKKDLPAFLAKKMRSKRCVVQIQNRDQRCLPRAIVVGRVLADGDRHQYTLIQRADSAQQGILAGDLLREAGVPDRACTLEDLPAFQAALPGYQIKVLSTSHMNAIVYKGPDAPKKILIIHSEGHFNLLTSIAAFMNRSYWCHACDKGYDSRFDHRCKNVCQMCLREDCPRDETNPWECGDCNRRFLGRSCFDHHKNADGRDAICATVSRCLDCGCTVSQKNRNADNPHQCGESFCQLCGVFALPDKHKCYMKTQDFTAKDKKKHREAKFLYFDFETYVNEEFKLVPNLAVIQDDEGNEKIFPAEDQPLGRDICDDICEFIFSQDHKDHYVIAHNFRAFDGYFILNWVVRMGLSHEIIMNGGNIQQLDVFGDLNIRFRDSLNFNPQALSKWPATFGVPNLAKGTFPHRFNRPNNWNQAGPLPYPDLVEFGYGEMTAKAKADLLAWYEEDRVAKNNQYDFRTEFTAYCQTDVRILRLCCQQFRKIFMEISGGLCPFVSALTIAGLCSFYYRTRFLKDKQIAIIPRRSGNRFQSKVAIQWLEWESQERNIDIQHIRNRNREFKVGRNFVDGFSEEINTVFEFHGCWYHGCPKCTFPDTVRPLKNIPMHQVYADTLSRDEYIRSQHYDLVIMWECEFLKKIRLEADLKLFVKNFIMPQPLLPRDAFFGGRTNAIKLHHQVQGEEKILYYDVTSLYPFVNKRSRYPIGHHQRITKNFLPLDRYFGLVKCTVLPPRNLGLPVLPVRCNGKLTFALCRTCAEHQQPGPCEHTDEERRITGTWCTPEVLKAIQRGYQVVQLQEVWHFEDSKVGLFAEYINRFLKIKTESSGWPVSCDTPAEKRQFIQEFQQKEGIRLEEDKMVANPGMRALSKLCLNSFWGRFGMREDHTNTVYITEPKQFFDILLSGKHCVTSWDMFSDEVVMLQYKAEEGFEEANGTVNCIIAAFTTCWARLHLLSLMEEIEGAEQGRLLYHDTDSIIFVSKPNVHHPALGNFLGDLTSELKPGRYIEEFVSLGPKSYAYRTNDNKTCAKVKGFSLNSSASERLNFESMKEMLRHEEVVTVTYKDTLKRCKRTLEINQVPTMSKRCRLTFDKRYIADEQYNTLPYGY